MRLIINAIPLLGGDSGIGNYTRHIGAAALDGPDDATFYYGYLSKKLAAADNSSWLASLGGLARKGGLCRRAAKKALSFASRIGSAINPQAWDCYFEPNFVLLPTIKARCSIITIHDFSCFRYPQWHPADRVAYMRKEFWQSVARASHIITVSGAIREEACSMYDIDPARVTAIPNGVDHDLFRPAPPADIAALRQRYGLPEHFILYVGAFEPRKNICNLIKAHALLPLKLRERFPLILVGAQGWNNGEIMDMLRREAAYARLIGHAPLAELPVFYSAADFFAYPSWYEGFGLPALEAMACGKATLASDAPALVELCQGAALHAPPGDVEALAEGLRQLIEDGALRQKMEQTALKRAKDFSWQASASRHLRLFRKIAAIC